MSPPPRFAVLALPISAIITCKTIASEDTSRSAANPTTVVTMPTALQAEPTFDQRVLASNLSSPHQMRWGPDNQIWLTERTAGRLDRIDPTTGAKTVLFTMPDVLITKDTQDGLLGLALHPELGQGTSNDFVYLALSIKADARSPQQSGQTIIRRYTYDAVKNTLMAPKDLIIGLPHSSESVRASGVRSG